MASDACDKFVGPMPVELFLSNFVPQAPNTRPTATITFTHSAVSENENQIASIITLVDAPSHTFLRFLQLIEDAGLCPNLRFINTTSCIATNLKPDISIYSGIDRNGPWTCASNPPPPEWRAVDLWIENKNQNNDVFRDLEQMKRETTAKSDLRGHIRWSKDAYRVSGQLIAYTSAIHRSQFRIFSFSVVLFGNIGCLLCWDRSGVIYTEPFNWTTQPDTLFKFLWKLNFLSDMKRGYDTTVTSVREDKAEAALSKLRTYQGLENVAKADLHKFLVRDDHTLNGQIKYYIAPSAVWDSEAHLGRSTFGYIAYDLETTNLVYLKDFWCTDCDGSQKEGDIYPEMDSILTVTRETVVRYTEQLEAAEGDLAREAKDVQATLLVTFGPPVRATTPPRDPEESSPVQFVTWSPAKDPSDAEAQAAEEAEARERLWKFHQSRALHLRAAILATQYMFPQDPPQGPED
ncbi:hypothetical protein EDB87DRAFT_1826506 [Lactarius vividus]|nr:hypothetical protein EDB87DRAFT_1826506 [Lactarius vividus]